MNALRVLYYIYVSRSIVYKLAATNERTKIYFYKCAIILLSDSDVNISLTRDIILLLRMIRVCERPIRGRLTAVFVYSVKRTKKNIVVVAGNHHFVLDLFFPLALIRKMPHYHVYYVLQKH